MTAEPGKSAVKLRARPRSAASRFPWKAAFRRFTARPGNVRLRRVLPCPGDGLADAMTGAASVIGCLEGRSGHALKDFPRGGARLIAAQARGRPRVRPTLNHNCDQARLRSGPCRPRGGRAEGAGGKLKALNGFRGHVIRMPAPGSLGKFLSECRNVLPSERYGSKTLRRGQQASTAVRELLA